MTGDLASSRCRECTRVSVYPVARALPAEPQMVGWVQALHCIGSKTCDWIHVYWHWQDQNGRWWTRCAGWKTRSDANAYRLERPDGPTYDDIASWWTKWSKV